MYHFAIITLMALALVKVVDFLVDQMSGMQRMRSALTFVGAVGTMVLIDYSLFESWGITIDNDWLGAWLTGFMVAGLTVVWRGAFSYLTHHQSPIDEPLGDHHPLLERVS